MTWYFSYFPYKLHKNLVLLTGVPSVLRRPVTQQMFNKYLMKEWMTYRQKSFKLLTKCDWPLWRFEHNALWPQNRKWQAVSFSDQPLKKKEYDQGGREIANTWGEKKKKKNWNKAFKVWKHAWWNSLSPWAGSKDVTWGGSEFWISYKHWKTSLKTQNDMTRFID